MLVLRMHTFSKLTLVHVSNIAQYSDLIVTLLVLLYLYL